MKCPKCGNDIYLKLGAKLISKGCKVLTAMTTIITVECEKCNSMFQISMPSNSFMVIKKEEKKKE